MNKESMARMRLICFPHAGGAASAFRLWPAALPLYTEVLAVQYPGRGNRLSDPLVDRISAMARCVRQEFIDRPEIPTIFFGHSMGGLVAFEAARQLIENPAQLPRHLVVSARAPPHVPATQPRIAHLPDAEFLRELAERYGAVPAEIMHHPDVLAWLLPALRSDLTAVEHCGESVRERITCPITVFAGAEDHTATHQQLTAWQELTGGEFDLRVFPGGHFFIDSQRPVVLGALSRLLQGLSS
jgi:medium-chain acyl-[acyl-carrier-protein] hydrolase